MKRSLKRLWKSYKSEMNEINEMYASGEINIAELHELKDYVYRKKKYGPIMPFIEEKITWKNLVFSR